MARRPSAWTATRWRGAGAAGRLAPDIPFSPRSQSDMSHSTPTTTLAALALAGSLMVALLAPARAQDAAEAPEVAAAKAEMAKLEAAFQQLGEAQMQLRKVGRELVAAMRASVPPPKEKRDLERKLQKDVAALGAALDRQIDPTRAALEKALEVEPKNVELLLKLAHVAGLRGDGAVVMSAMDRAVEAKPDDLQLRFDRGVYAYKAMFYAKALGDFEILQKAGGQRAHAVRDYFMRSLVWTHQFTRARKELEASLKTAHAHQAASLRDLLAMVKDYEAAWPKEQALRKAEAEKDDLPRVKLTTSKGEILLELFENEAPNTVANFVQLVESGFYNKTLFHMKKPHFMLQGGCPYTRDKANRERHGQGHPGYLIPDELGENARLHFAGTLTMANARGLDTNGSQFMITYVPAGWLNVVRQPQAPPRGHTVFGRVVTGMDVVRQLDVGDELTKAEVLRKRDHPYALRHKKPLR